MRLRKEAKRYIIQSAINHAEKRLLPARNLLRLTMVMVRRPITVLLASTKFAEQNEIPLFCESWPYHIEANRVARILC